VLGFLPWNFNPAVIFLGDCGSLLIGFGRGSRGRRIRLTGRLRRRRKLWRRARPHREISAAAGKGKRRNDRRHK
jgi:hypothetical protein